MRLALLLVVAAAPALAEPLPSGLADPLANAESCATFAEEVAAGGDPMLQAIAFAEGRAVHKAHSDDAKTATDLLFARADGSLDMQGEAVAVYLDRVCRAL